jgi:glycosyltransferase involved in cell wall biosynthesis
VVAALYRRVDLILAQSEAFVEAIRPLAGEVPVMYFPNPGDRTCILDIEGPIRLPPGFNVVFAGNLGRAQALETVLDAASLLREERDIRITLFGSGARERWIRGEIARRGLSNVALGGRVAPVVMREIYRRASAALLTLADDAMLAKTIPSKLQSYLGAGVPVIAAATGESARVVRDSGGGIVCAPENPAALASAILKLRDCRPEEIEAMRRNAQAYYDANFEPRLLSKRLMSQLRALVDERQGR